MGNVAFVESEWFFESLINLHHEVLKEVSSDLALDQSYLDSMHLGISNKRQIHRYLDRIVMLEGLQENYEWESDSLLSVFEGYHHRLLDYLSKGNDNGNGNGNSNGNGNISPWKQLNHFKQLEIIKTLVDFHQRLENAACFVFPPKNKERLLKIANQIAEFYQNYCPHQMQRNNLIFSSDKTPKICQICKYEKN